MVIVSFGVLVVALYMLVAGSRYVLHSTRYFGDRFGLTSFGAGAIIVGTLTSLPDLVAAIAGQMQDASDIVVGIAVGANIADIFLIAAIIAILAKGVRVIERDLTFDIAWLVASTIALIVVLYDGSIVQSESFMLVVLFCIYLLATYALTNKPQKHEERNMVRGQSWYELTKLVLGFGLLIGGAHLAVKATLALSVAFGVATGVIGLFALALGTTLPELSVTLRAIREKESSLALGNVFGSNIFNALAVVGIPGLLGVVVPDAFTYTYGLLVLVGATTLFAFTIYSRGGLSRAEGMVYLIAYAMFIVLSAHVIA